MRLCENFEIPPTAVGGWFRSFLQKPHFAPMKEIPPTAVGGLFRSGLRTNEGRATAMDTLVSWTFYVKRLDLNHPPTAVGGISEVFTQPR